jgi:hypothetical protein
MSLEGKVLFRLLRGLDLFESNLLTSENLKAKAGSTLAANSRGIKWLLTPSLAAHSLLVCYPFRQDAAIAT